MSHASRVWWRRSAGGVRIVIVTIVCLVVGSAIGAGTRVEPEGKFELHQPVPELAGDGSIFVHDLDGDGVYDFIVTSAGHIGAYDNSGALIWVREVEMRFFEFAHHPSAIAGDTDGDGDQEVGFLRTDGPIAILDGTTGETEGTLETAGNPTAMAIANLRGLGDRDIVLQLSQTQLRAITADGGEVLWETDQYRCIEHSPVRQADIDGDGLDEMAGATIIDDDGSMMNEWTLGGAYRNMDSMVIADIVPGLPLEVALAEQRGANSHTVVVNPAQIVFRALNPWNWEDPDKVAVGDFDPDRPGLEIFNRSSGGDGTGRRGDEEPYRHEECPWVLAADGSLITRYYVNDKKPSWWTGHGLEEICRIDWDGDDTDEIVAKERHKVGAGAIVNPITGEFMAILPGEATRIYAADVHGDYREEAIIVDENGTVKIFADSGSPGKTKPRYWTQQHYRRQKQNWNYYSP